MVPNATGGSEADVYPMSAVEDLVVELEAPAELNAVEADAFSLRCGVARAEVVDRVLLRALDELGWSLFDDGVVDRVSVEHQGPTRARILVDGKPVTPWWEDRVRTAHGKQFWSYEPKLD